MIRMSVRFAVQRRNAKKIQQISMYVAKLPGAVERHIINFVGRDAMDIKEIWYGLYWRTCAFGYIRDIADIFELKDHKKNWSNRNYRKKKEYGQTLDTIEKAKENDAYMLLTGFGIPNVGKAAAKTMWNVFLITDLEEADRNSNGGGWCRRSECRRHFPFLFMTKNRAMINRLKSLGVNMEAEETRRSIRQSAENSSYYRYFCRHWEEKEAAELVEKYGGKVSGSVSKRQIMLLREKVRAVNWQKHRNLNNRAYGSRTVCPAWN